jgi:mannose/cellobiose epimerase-like protein (N-acyl-D-glucosamine 2-epimerase family)
MGFPGGLDIAEDGWRFMREHGWRAEGGWARQLGRHGGVLDPTLNLYDQAFALLAIAWWVKASGDDGALTWAERTLDAIDTHLTAPRGVGWLSEDGPNARLLQNPHMHVLEALLALHAVAQEARFKSAAARVLDLFESALFDAETGTVAEYYRRRWRRARGVRGRIIEPGHHYEWCWLLHQAERVIPGSARHAGDLLDFAERFGSEPQTGLIYDQTLDDGSVRAAGHHGWPHMEAIKAHLARFEHRGVLDAQRTTQILDNLFRYFLSAPGTWIDRLGSERRPNVEQIPAGTLYHVLLGFSELLRLEPELRSAGPGGTR